MSSGIVAGAAEGGEIEADNSARDADTVAVAAGGTASSRSHSDRPHYRRRRRRLLLPLRHFHNSHSHRSPCHNYRHALERGGDVKPP